MSEIPWAEDYFLNAQDLHNENEEKSHSHPDNEDSQPSTKGISNLRGSNLTGHSICRMSKHRTVRTIAVPLPETSIYKTFADKKIPTHHASKRSNAQWSKPMSSDARDAKFLAALKQLPKVNDDDSDSENSVLATDSITTDTNSVFSDDASSVINDDFDQALTLSFKKSSEDEDDEVEADQGFLSRGDSLMSQDESSVGGLAQNLFENLIESNGEDDVTEDNMSQSSADSQDLAAKILKKELHSLRHSRHALTVMKHKGSFPLSNPKQKPRTAISHQLSKDENSSIDERSDITTFSCGSMSLDQDGLLLAEQYGGMDSSQKSDYKSLEADKVKLSKELQLLKQSLKLSEADTAILVSAKQQLQLDLQELHEANRSLNVQLEKAISNATTSDKNVITLKRTLERQQENHSSEVRVLNENLRHWKEKLLQIDDSFETVRLDNTELKQRVVGLEKGNDLRNLQNNSLHKEVNELVAQNTKLSTLIERSSEDHVGSQEYITTIRAERDEYAKRLHEKNQELLTQQIAIQGWEERHNRTREENLSLSSEKEKLLKSVQDDKILIKSLQAQLSMKSNEKEALDNAVSRLHDDLFKVETGFHKIKREIMQKSGLAEREGSLNVKLKQRVSMLEKEIEQLKSDSELHAQRIGDKNNQIAQLLNQTRSQSNERSLACASVEQLKAYIASNEKSWVKAIEREKQLASDLKAKTASLHASDTLCGQLTLLLEEEKAKALDDQHDFEAKLSARQDQVARLQNEVSQLKFDVDKKDESIRSHDIALERMKLEIRKRDQEKETYLQKMQESLVQSVDYAAAGDDVMNTDGQMELVAELQNSRRELAEKVNSLRSERERLETEQEDEREAFKRRLQEELTAKESTQQEKLNVELKLNKKLMELGKKIDEKEAKIDSMRNELLEFTRTYEEKTETTDELKRLLDSSQKEVITVTSRNATLKEELTLVKHEMNMNALKLIEDMEKKSDESGRESQLAERLQQVSTERDRLREAVEQQQRYMLALQSHYQQWASGAVEQLRHAQASATATPKSNATVGSQTNFDERHLADGFSQTDHSLEPVRHQWPNEGSTIESERFVPTTQSATKVENRSTQCETAHLTVVRELVSGPAVDDFTQTEHDMEAVCGAKRSVMQLDDFRRSDRSSQTGHAHLKDRPSDVGTQTELWPPEVAGVAVSVQTDQSIDVAPRSVPPSMVDGFVQTDHNLEHIDKRDDLSPQLLEEVFVQTEAPSVATRGVQTSHDAELCGGLLDSSDDLGMRFEGGITWRGAVGERRTWSKLVDAHSQTDHDDKPATPRKRCTSALSVMAVSTDDLFGDDDRDVDIRRMRGRADVPFVAKHPWLDEDDSLSYPPVDPPPRCTTCPACGKLSDRSQLRRCEASSTQTDHDLDPVPVSLVRFMPGMVDASTDTQDWQATSGESRPFAFFDFAENVGTQTDHDTDPASLASKQSQSPQISGDPHQRDNRLESMPDIDTRGDYPKRTDLSATGTQTDHDFDPAFTGSNWFASDKTVPISENAETQTEHDIESTCSRCRQANTKLQAPIHAVAAATQSENPALCVHCDVSQQTDHDWDPVRWADLNQSTEQGIAVNVETQTPSNLRSVSICQYVDGFAQTEHDFEPVCSGSNLNDLESAAAEQGVRTYFDHPATNQDLNQEHSVNAVVGRSCYPDSVVTSQTGASFERAMLADAAAQTEVPVCSSSTQTDHAEETFPPGIQTHHGVGASCSDLARSQSTQTDHENELLPLPNPADVAVMLNTSDAGKLKAYKGTVKVLKNKLKRAEERLSSQSACIAAMKEEIASYQALAEAKCSPRSVDSYDGEEKQDPRFQEEIELLKDAAGSKDVELTTLKVELGKLKRNQEEALSKQRRKAVADRVMGDRKLKEANGRVKALVGANESLRKTVEKIQVKLTASQQHLESARRDKLRYQQRSRKLQADLRSLSWISQPSPSDKESSALTEDESSALAEGKDNSRSFDSKSDAARSPLGDVEDSLRTLRIEISSLEKQLTNHNQVVRQSKANWLQLSRRESLEKGDVVPREPVRQPLNGKGDWLGEIV